MSTTPKDGVAEGAFWCEETQTWLYKDESRKAFKNRRLDPQPAPPDGVEEPHEVR